MKLLYIPFLVFVLSSCVIYGITNDYDKLTGEQRNSIIPYSKATSFEIGKIYTLNAQELKSEMEKHPKSLVYIFANGCSSESCLPMAVYEEYAKKHNRKLFLIMTGYGALKATTNQPLASPLYAIDNDFYQEKKHRKYYRCFKNDLQGRPLDYKETKEDYQGDFYGSLYFYSGNHLDSVCRELPKNRVITPSF